MDIKSYLLELIATRKTVGINALGTLYKKKIPGRYDSETHSYLPPKQEVVFTTDISEDTTLAHFISEKRNISVESANYYINEFVELIQSQLADHQHVDFSPFGDLKISDSQIVLEPSKSADVSFDFYGLPSVSATPGENLETNSTQGPETTGVDLVQEKKEEELELETSVAEQEVETNGGEPEAIATQDIDTQRDIVGEKEATSEYELDEQPVFEEIADVNHVQEQNELEERVDVESEPEKTLTDKKPSITDPLWKPTVIHRYEYDDEDEDENSGGWTRKFLKAVFALVIIAAIAGAVIYYFYPDLYYSIKGDLSEQPIESEPILNVDTNASTKIDSSFSDTIQTPLVLPSVDSLSTKKSNKTTVYEVIGSAMKTQKKADEVISVLSKRGINAKKVDVMPGRMIKISLGTFTDFNLAKKFQDSLKIRLRNPEIYIQTIKPKN